MRLAICLLTCDRPEYTKATLKSLIATNWQLVCGIDADTILLHADDGSISDRNDKLASQYFFKKVYGRPKGNRGGAGIALRSMWRSAVEMGATHILHLENDWEIVAPIPLFPGADTVRLYGRKKERGEGPRSRTGQHIAGTSEKIQWIPSAYPGYELAQEASWGGPPSITKAAILIAATEPDDPPRSIKEITKALARIYSIRPIENIVFHIGEQKTPGTWGD